MESLKTQIHFITDIVERPVQIYYISLMVDNKIIYILIRIYVIIIIIKNEKSQKSYKL